MNHILLPSQSEGASDLKPNCYGTHALPNLLREFKSRGSLPKDLKAWLIGGAVNVLHGMDVGTKNCDFARGYLERCGIEFSATAIGGSRGRQVEFDTANGEVRCRYVRQADANDAQEGPIKVLVVDDSKALQLLLSRAITTDPRLKLIGVASDPIEADVLISKERPDVISLDLFMPKENGDAYLRRTMKRDPIPTLIVTGIGKEDSEPVINALEAGAFDWLQKPDFSGFDNFAKAYTERLKIGALRARKKNEFVVPKVFAGVPNFSAVAIHEGLIAIGASTGGTEAIKEVLTRLPAEIPPIVIVQHMPPHFTKYFAERLNDLCPFDVFEATNGMVVKKNQVLIAPGGFQMRIVQKLNQTIVEINEDAPVNLFKPSVDYLFHSLAKINNRRIAAALLTGMGADGAKGLLLLKQKGVHTIVQDEQSSVVFGMPKAAFELGAACEIVDIVNVAQQFVSSFR